VQNLPFESDGSGGVSIPQPSGVEPGSRTVSGSVTVGTLATAQAWAVAQRALLTGDKLGGSYPRQEERRRTMSSCLASTASPPAARPMCGCTG